jgi:hypothetical protein
MKYLVTSGCSFTSATRVNLHREDDVFLNEPKKFYYYPHWLQLKFPDIKVINMGNPGNNNSLIVRSIIYKIKQLLKEGVNPNEIGVICQWSSYFRRSEFVSKDKKDIQLNDYKEYANDFIKEKKFTGENGFWLELAVPDMKYSPIERIGNGKVYNCNQLYYETFYNDESRFIEWLEYFDYLIQFCENLGINLKCFFMHNSFSLQYDYGLMPYNWKDSEQMIESLFVKKEIINTWNDQYFRNDIYPYAKYLYDSIDWDKYCWFFEEEGIHKYGGVFEWTIRNQVESTDDNFNPIWMEYEDFGSQSKVLDALRNNKMGPTGHVSSCNYKKFTEEVILNWDMFKNLN